MNVAIVVGWPAEPVSEAVADLRSALRRRGHDVEVLHVPARGPATHAAARLFVVDGADALIALDEVGALVRHSRKIVWLTRSGSTLDELSVLVHGEAWHVFTRGSGMTADDIVDRLPQRGLTRRTHRAPPPAVEAPGRGSGAATAALRQALLELGLHRFRRARRRVAGALADVWSRS